MEDLIKYITDKDYDLTFSSGTIRATKLEDDDFIQLKIRGTMKEALEDLIYIIDAKD